MRTLPPAPYVPVTDAVHVGELLLAHMVWSGAATTSYVQLHCTPADFPGHGARIFEALCEWPIGQNADRLLRMRDGFRRVDPALFAYFDQRILLVPERALDRYSVRWLVGRIRQGGVVAGTISTTEARAA